MEVRRHQFSDQAGFESSYPESYLADFPFYTYEERKFRYLRDEVLGPSRYSAVMWSMIDEDSSFDVQEVKGRLWMGSSDLESLLSEGHSIGLHSHSHPTRIDHLPRAAQAREYRQNFDWIQENLGVTPKFVAHPCGRYSTDTIEILLELGVEMGFKSSMTRARKSSSLEIPREDHATVLRQMSRR